MVTTTNPVATDYTTITNPVHYNDSRHTLYSATSTIFSKVPIDTLYNFQAKYNQNSRSCDAVIVPQYIRYSYHNIITTNQHNLY